MQTPADRRTAWVAAIAVTVLVVANILPSPHAQLWPDTVRDVSQSLALARGERLILVGPQINMGPHLGPAWIWLQAIVLPFATSLAAVSVWVAIVSSLKFPLLYALGRELAGPRLGLCFALAAALPSIAVYQWLVFWHPNWVEPAILGSLLLLAASRRRGSIGYWYGAIGLLGLAIQMHPTALLYSPLHAWVLWRLAGARRVLIHAAAGLAAIGLWFVPLLFANISPAAATGDSFVSRLAHGLAAFDPGEVVVVLRTAFVEVPCAIGTSYAKWLGLGDAAWRGLIAVPFGIALFGLVRDTATDREGRRLPIVAAAAALLATWTLLVGVRTFTSFYLGYFLLPLACVLWGYGLEGAWSSRLAPLRIAAVASLVAAFATFVAAAIGAQSAARDGFVRTELPRLMDLKHPAPGEAQVRWIGAHERDAMARFACARGGKVAAHGEWAYVLAGSTNLDLRMHCPASAPNFRLFGAGEGLPGWTLLAQAEAARLGRKAPQHFGRLAAFPVIAAPHPAGARPIDPDWHYFEQLREPPSMTRVTLAFTTPPGASVMVYRLKPFAARFEDLSVRRNGVEARASLSTYNSDVFASDAGAPTAWVVAFETDAPGWADVHAF